MLDLAGRANVDSPGKIVVAVPVKNEEERIGGCLNALLSQSSAADHIVLFLNDCQDATAAVCRTVRARHRHIHIVECDLPEAVASAGEARRLALEYGAQLTAGGDPVASILLTTDADAVTAPDWIARNCRAIRAGADAVCGRVEIDPAEAALVPARLHEDQAREDACFALLDEISALADPDPADPWPRHGENAGASIAVTVAAFCAAGGAPRVSTGEDRALIRNVALTDGKIRHAPEIVVRVSGRLEGRAAGGMAETMRNRVAAPELWCDARIEPAADAYRRALARAAARAVWRGELPASALAHDLLCAPEAISAALRARHFGAAWVEVEALSPVLKRRRVPVAELVRESRQAALLRGHLRGRRCAAGGRVRGEAALLSQAHD